MLIHHYCRLRRCRHRRHLNTHHHKSGDATPELQWTKRFIILMPLSYGWPFHHITSDPYQGTILFNLTAHHLTAPNCVLHCGQVVCSVETPCWRQSGHVGCCHFVQTFDLAECSPWAGDNGRLWRLIGDTRPHTHSPAAQRLNVYIIKQAVTSTFRAFSRRFDLKRLTIYKYICHKTVLSTNNH